MENSNNNQSGLTKDDLVSVLHEFMKEKETKEEKQPKQTETKEDVVSAIEKYLEKRESEKKAQEILDKAEVLSNEVEAEVNYETLNSNPLESMRLQLEKHIDNIRNYLKYENYESGLMSSQNTGKWLDVYRVFWHSICHNKGGKEGSQYIIDQIRSKGIKDPSSYLLKY